MTEPKTKIDISARQLTAVWPKVGYDGEDDAIRNFYSKNIGKTKDRTSFFASKKLADIFIFAMTLGKNEGVRKPYEKKKDRKDSIDFEYISQQPEYLWMMIAVAIEESDGDLGIFKDPQTRIIDVCEEYANYGIELLMNMEKESTATDPYAGYEKKFRELLSNLND